MTPEEFARRRGRGVSRETWERLGEFAAFLLKWNQRINLIGRATADQVWQRHILDSVQVFDLSGPPEGKAHWADLGSGGGFPGLVAAILATEEAPGLALTLIESDQRKTAFLATAAHHLGLTLATQAARAESLPPLVADILSARALAPLSALLPLAHRHLATTGRAFFPKGAAHQREIDETLATWRCRLQKHPSITDPSGVILEIEGTERV